MGFFFDKNINIEYFMPHSFRTNPKTKSKIGEKNKTIGYELILQTIHIFWE